MKIGKSFWWVLGLLIISLVVATNPAVKDNTIYIRLAITWALIIVISWFWSRFSLSGVLVFRRARILRQQVGQLFIERFDIINQNPLTKIWIKVADEAELPGSDGSRIISNIGAHSSKSYSSNTLLQYRGTFNLGPTILSSGDIFGIFSYSRKIESQSRLMVLPYMVDLTRFPAPFGLLPGGRALRRKTTEVTPFSAGVREYFPGDPLRRIHWPTSARKQKLIVKEFEKDPLAEVWIFLDASKVSHSELDKGALIPKTADSFFWMGFKPRFELPPSSLEYAISAAASIAKYYLGQKREVGLGVSGQIHSIIPSERGERQLEKILETLALIRAEGNTSLYSLVGQQIGSLVRGSTIVLITATVDDEVVDTAAELLQRDLLPVVVLLDSESFGGKSGSVELEKRLISLGIIVLRVSYGDDLTVSLERSQSFTQRAIIH
jgi:uncharacterized protein (DUF58 family)